MVRRWAVVVSALALVACTDSPATRAPTSSAPTSASLPPATSADGSVPPPTTDGGTTTTAPPPAPGWTPDISRCADAGALDAVLTSPIAVASLAPTQGLTGAAATPVTHALQVGLATLPTGDAPTFAFTSTPDPQDPQARAEVASAAVASGAQLFVGTVGAEASETVAESLATACVPQLFSLGDAERLDDPATHPFTISGSIPASVEADAFAASIVGAVGPNAAVGMFATVSETGDAAVAAMESAADDAGLRMQPAVRAEAFDGIGVIVAANQLADASLDAVVVASSGLDCITFLQAWHDAVDRITVDDAPGPAVYLAGGCASRAVLRGAGSLADGAVSASVFVDVADPAKADDPAVATYVAAMRGAGHEAEADYGVAGWVMAEATIAIVQQAAASPSGLTRVSIMRAARSLTFTSPLLRPGLTLTTSGDADRFLFDAVQLVRYSSTTDTLADA